MKPSVVFENSIKESVQDSFLNITASPYEEYDSFLRQVEMLLNESKLPQEFLIALEKVAAERKTNPYSVHLLRNCPLDPVIPHLGHDDPQSDKHRLKDTFVAEAMLATVSMVWGNPIMSYAQRFQGDYFTDVYAISKYMGKQTGYSDGELVYHNDRTAHSVRADYINLLGMRCPSEEYTCTAFVSAEALRQGLSVHEIEILSSEWFETPFDVVSKENNKTLKHSDRHSIFRCDGSIRYLDSHTKPVKEAPFEVRDAFDALRDSLSRSQKVRHRLLEGDLFTFPNQGGLHSREIIEIIDTQRSRERWLLKTYSLSDAQRAEATRKYWAEGRPLCMMDSSN